MCVWERIFLDAHMPAMCVSASLLCVTKAVDTDLKIETN